MEVLASRVLLLSADPERLQSFYRERLGLPVHREYPGGVVFFAGNGLIEISSHMKTDEPAPSSDSVLWLQVRDAEAVAAEAAAPPPEVIAAATTSARQAAAPAIRPWRSITAQGLPPTVLRRRRGSRRTLMRAPPGPRRCVVRRAGGAGSGTARARPAPGSATAPVTWRS